MYDVEFLNFSIFAMVFTGILFWMIWNFADEFDYEDFVHRWLGRISAFVVSFYIGVNFQCLYNDLPWISPWDFICGNFYDSSAHVYLASFVFSTMAFFVMLIATYMLIAEIRGGIGILFLLATMVFLPLAALVDGIYTMVVTNIRWLTILLGITATLLCIGFAICCIARIYDNITYNRKIKMKGRNLR